MVITQEDVERALIFDAEIRRLGKEIGTALGVHAYSGYLTQDKTLMISTLYCEISAPAKVLWDLDARAAFVEEWKRENDPQTKELAELARLAAKYPDFACPPKTAIFGGESDG